MGSYCFLPAIMSSTSLSISKFLLAASSEKFLRTCAKMRKFRSSCTCAKYHPSFAPFIHSIVPNDSVSSEWRPWSDCADTQAELGHRCPHMPEDISHGTVHLLLTESQSESQNRLYLCKKKKKKKKKKQHAIPQNNCCNNNWSNSSYFYNYSCYSAIIAL